jgi:hypothetical protein
MKNKSYGIKQIDKYLKPIQAKISELLAKNAYSKNENVATRT